MSCNCEDNYYIAAMRARELEATTNSTLTVVERNPKLTGDSSEELRDRFKKTTLSTYRKFGEQIYKNLS